MTSSCLLRSYRLMELSLEPSSHEEERESEQVFFVLTKGSLSKVAAVVAEEAAAATVGMTAEKQCAAAVAARGEMVLSCWDMMTATTTVLMGCPTERQEKKKVKLASAGWMGGCVCEDFVLHTPSLDTS